MNNRIGTTCMNFENNKTSDSQKRLLNHFDIIGLKRVDRYFANLSI